MDIKFSKLEELTALISNMVKEKLHKRNLIPHIEVNKEEVEPKKIYEEIKLDLDRVKDVQTEYKSETKFDLFDSNDELNNENIYANESETLVINDSFIEQEEVEKENRLPELYPVGLVHGTYIICQNEKGMYMIDQHAAKERVNYEMYKEKLGNPTQSSIDLLIPMTLEFSNDEFVLLKENLDLLRNIGFKIEEFGINSIIVKAHPTWLLKNYEQEQTRKIIEVILQKEKDFSIVKFNEKIATMLSCKMAIKANMNITIEEMESLINDLRKCDNPFNCPHGRPTIIFYSNYDLEKLFKRSGFENKL